MKKIISAAVAAALIISAVPIISATAADVTSCEFSLTPDKSTVHPGETVTYTFSIIPNGDVYALQAFLELPEGFSLVEGSGKLLDGVKEQLKWDDIAVTESDKLIFSGFTAQNPYTDASELKIAEFECKADSDAKNGAPSLSRFYVLNGNMDEPSEQTTSFLPVTVPGLIKVDAKTPTCTERGNNEYYVCEDNCGRVYKDPERKTETTVEAETLDMGHKFVTENISEEYLKSEATCISPAVYYKRCILCGAKSEETFTVGEADPNKHSGGKANCSQKAVCELCGNEYGEVDPNSHSGGKANCSQKAVCELCGNEYGEVDPNSHSGGKANCSQKAVCELCGNEYGEVDPNNHSGGKANCSKKAVCELCGNEYGEVDPNNHSGGKANCSKKAVCELCGNEYGEVDPNSHSGGKANCSKKSVCELCGNEYGEVDPTNHGSIELRNVYAATETEEGYTGDKYCVDCGTLLEKGSVIPKLEPTTPPDNPKPDTPVTPPIYRPRPPYNPITSETHSGGKATCSKKAVCELCGEEYGEFDPSNHVSIELRNASAATETNEGYTGDKCCADCGTLIEKGSVIPKLEPATPPDDPVPDTSDMPDKSETFDTPDTSETSDTPETSDTLEMPDTPDTPDVPDNVTGSVTMNVIPGNYITDIKVTTPLDTLSDNILTGNERELLLNGTDIDFILSVDDTSGIVSNKDKAIIEKKLNSLEKYMLGQYFDMSLIKITGALVETVTTVAAPITISVKIPHALQASNRTYAVIRVHNGKAAILEDLDKDTDTITFESDRFSAYALIYYNNAEIKSDIPYTGAEDFIWVFVIAVAALLLCILIFFTTGRFGLSEERKEHMFSRLIAWGKKGGRLRSVIALGLISLLLVYYYGIGMKTPERHK